MFDLWGIRKIIKQGHWLVTLGGCHLLDGLVVAAVELSKGDCGGDPVEVVRGFVLVSPEWRKATPVDIEIWEVHWSEPARMPSGFLVGSSRISLNPLQRGLGVTGKSPRPREKILCLALWVFSYSFTFKHFFVLYFSRDWIDTCHSSLQTHFAQHRLEDLTLFVVLIKFA